MGWGIERCTQIHLNKGGYIDCLCLCVRLWTKFLRMHLFDAVLAMFDWQTFKIGDLWSKVKVTVSCNVSKKQKKKSNVNEVCTCISTLHVITIILIPDMTTLFNILAQIYFQAIWNCCLSEQKNSMSFLGSESGSLLL